MLKIDFNNPITSHVCTLLRSSCRVISSIYHDNQYYSQLLDSYEAIHDNADWNKYYDKIHSYSVYQMSISDQLNTDNYCGWNCCHRHDYIQAQAIASMMEVTITDYRKHRIPVRDAN